MPAPLAVDKEAVRVLVVAVGPREAARQMGLKQSTVMQWSARGGWLDHTRVANQPKPPMSMQPVIVSGVINPADALASTLSERHRHTKLGLSLFSARAARVASRLPKGQLLAQAPDVKAVADIMGKVWPEQGIQSIRLSMFTRDQPIEVEAEFVPDAEP